MEKDDEIMKPQQPSMEWLVTFADLVSLLITFFVLLYSMKVLDVQKWDELKGSFEGVFSIRSVIYEITPDKEFSFDKLDASRSANLDYLQSLLVQSFKNNPVLMQLDMKRDYALDTLSFSISTDNIFEDGTSVLSGEGQSVFTLIGDVFRYVGNRIIVAVHTDPEITPTRVYPSNWELSMMRAIRVAELIEERGIERSLVTTAMADSKFDKTAVDLPLAERYKKARRIEIILEGEAGL